MTDSDNLCDCNHGKHDHIIVHKNMTLLAYLERGIFLTRQLEHGMCKKCTCPKYYPLRLFKSKRTMKYQARPRDMLDECEKRCRRCGTLFARHSERSHPFQDTPN